MHSERDGPPQKAVPIPEFEAILESKGRIIEVQMSDIYREQGYAIIFYPIGSKKVSIMFRFRKRGNQSSAWRGNYDLKVEERLRITVALGDNGYYAKEVWPA